MIVVKIYQAFLDSEQSDDEWLDEIIHLFKSGKTKNTIQKLKPAGDRIQSRWYHELFKELEIGCAKTTNEDLQSTNKLMINWLEEFVLKLKDVENEVLAWDKQQIDDWLNEHTPVAVHDNSLTKNEQFIGAKKCTGVGSSIIEILAVVARASEGYTGQLLDLQFGYIQQSSLINLV